MGTLAKIHQYRNNFSVKRSTKGVYTSLERHLYGRKDRAKFFDQKSNLKGSGDQYSYLGTSAKKHWYGNNFSIKISTKVVYTSLERYLYELNDRAKVSQKNQIWDNCS